MSELVIDVVGVEPDRFAAVPTLTFRLRVTESTGQSVHVLALRCQIRIEPQRRQYSPGEEERLLALFGETPQWGESLRPFLWTHASTVVPGFSGTTEVDLPVTCSYDLEVAGAKYLHALGDGEIPLILLFNGTAFTAHTESPALPGRSGPRGSFSVDPVPWHKEASFRLPVAVWRDLMDLYFPNSGWLRLPTQTLDALERYKTVQGLPTWDQAVEALIKQAEG